MALMKSAKHIKIRTSNIFKMLMFASIATFGISSCTRSNQSPGYEYMPDMYRSQSYKPYSASSVFKDGISARKPPAGSIAQNQVPFNYKNDPAEYERAGLELKSPLPESNMNKEKGKVLFIAFCSHCHGATGDGKGQIVKLDLFPPIPSFNNQLKELSEGKMFFSITYGKGLMGSHASQLDPEERWQIIQYIKELQTK